MDLAIQGESLILLFESMAFGNKLRVLEGFTKMTS